MNRKEVTELMPIIQAFLEGRTIECKRRSWELNKGWRDETQWEKTEQLIFRDTFVYRIKPEPKYRPFKDTEECWNEMQKHQPFGWVRSKEDGSRALITLMISERDIFINSIGGSTMYELMEKFTFADGAVFGILGEE